MANNPLVLTNKNVEVYALLAKVETTYGVGASCSLQTDGVMVNADPLFPVDYTNKGVRANPAGSYGKQLKNDNTGRNTKFKVPCELRGLPTKFASSASLEFDDLLRGCGLTSVFANNSYSYTHDTPSATPASVGMQLYTRGELRQVSGALGTFTITIADTKQPEIEFDYQGVLALPVDAALVSPVYPSATVLPPVIQGVNLTIGTLTGSILKELKYEQGRAITARSSIQTANAHGGFVGGRRAPKLTITIEATFTSLFNPYTGLEQLTTYPISCSMTGDSGNGGAGNSFFMAWNAQLETIAPAAEGNAAQWTLTFTPYCSSPVASDDFTLIAC